MNIVLPCAGNGLRFKQAGYENPKPFIKVSGKPMIKLVTDNLRFVGHYIYIMQKSHLKEWGNYLRNVFDDIDYFTFSTVDGVTEGAACTTLTVADLIDSDESLIIANSDQFVEGFDPDEFLKVMGNADAGIVTFTATNSKWSFAKVDNNGKVIEVAEKNPISNIATVGIYYWKHGSDYVKYAKQMIDKNIRVNGEFYVCPVFNEVIVDGKIVKTYHVENMWGLGTPEDLEIFKNRIT